VRNGVFAESTTPITRHYTSHWIGNAFLDGFIALSILIKYRTGFALWKNSIEVTGEKRVTANPAIGAGCACALMWDEAEAEQER